MSTEEAEKVFINSHQFNHAIESLRTSRVINLKQITKSIRARIEQLFTHVIKTFIEDLAQQSALKLWEKVDRQGNTHWYARDPDTGKTISFASEPEMLRWIEHLNSRNHW
jgi:Flp pilus assembly secretin CpaC